ncbi:MAG TPA: cobalt transporter CbiM, partial [Actinobacteria bacterium]|nr:cobalt transporter CbiM [Actinomycetes bacterium]HEX21583.1 cobalt transporter CbiM [Actinomycetota bacterium]
ALASAFSFVIMMFNIPIPGGTSGHAIGSALIAIILGPWSALISVTMALTVQALVFGDGGITALGANSFTMAFIAPFSAYYIYRFIAGRSAVFGRRQKVGAAMAGYISINLAALATALILGIQPLIATSATGQPLYFPYSLKVTIMAISGAHLLFFGVVESLITVLVSGYLAKSKILSLSGPGMIRPQVKEATVETT